MTEIRMVDLHGQYLKIKNEIDSAIHGVIDSASFINGPEVKNLATELEDYFGVKHVIPCANGTDALQIAMMALDLQPGDEIITSKFTFIATVEVIKLLRLTPVLVDVLPDTFNIDPKKIEEADIKAVAEKLDDPDYYVSGPYPMVDAYAKLLKQMGVAEAKIHMDDFPGYENI